MRNIEAALIDNLEKNGCTRAEASRDAYNILEAITAGDMSPEEAKGYGLTAEEFRALLRRARK